MVSIIGFFRVLFFPSFFFRDFFAWLPFCIRLARLSLYLINSISLIRICASLVSLFLRPSWLPQQTVVFGVIVWLEVGRALRTFKA